MTGDKCVFSSNYYLSANHNVATSIETFYKNQRFTKVTENSPLGVVNDCTDFYDNAATSCCVGQSGGPALAS